MKGWTSIQCVGQDLAQDGSVCRHCIHVHQGVCANKHTVIPPQQGTTTFPKCCYQHFLYTLQQHAYISTNLRHRWETNERMHTFACMHTLTHMRTHTWYWQKIHLFLLPQFCVFCTYCIWNFRVTKLRYRSQSAKSQRIPKCRAAWGFFFLFFVFLQINIQVILLMTWLLCILTCAISSDFPCFS